MGTMGKKSLAPGIDSKASITEHFQRQGPSLDGHLLFSSVLIESKNIFAQKCSQILQVLLKDLLVLLMFWPPGILDQRIPL